MVSMSTHSHPGRILTKQSLAVIKQHRRLIVFPLLSTLLSFALFIGVVIPIWHTEKAVLTSSPQNVELSTWIVLMFLAYFFVANFLINFANAALIASAQRYYDSEPVSLKEGWQHACKHTVSLFFWTLINTTIGILVRFLEGWSEHWDNWKPIYNYLSGLRWSIATFFVVPVLVMEPVSVLNAMKRSSQLLRDTWGEAKAARIGLGGFLLTARIIAFLPVAFGWLNGDIHAVMTGAIITITLLLLISIFNSTTNTVLLSALYHYAALGRIAGFEREALEKVFIKNK